jgi:hypothetical protein
LWATREFKLLGLASPREYRYRRKKNDDEGFFWWRARVGDAPNVFHCLDIGLRNGDSILARKSEDYYWNLLSILCAMIEMRAITVGVKVSDGLPGCKLRIVIPELGMDQQIDDVRNRPEPEVVAAWIVKVMRFWIDHEPLPYNCALQLFVARVDGVELRWQLAEYLLGFHRPMGRLASLQAMCRHAFSTTGVALPREWYSILPVITNRALGGDSAG